MTKNQTFWCNIWIDKIEDSPKNFGEFCKKKYFSFGYTIHQANSEAQCQELVTSALKGFFENFLYSN